MFTKFHRWYDTVQEPWRLLICLAIVTVLTSAVNFGFLPVAVRILIVAGVGLLVVTRIRFIHRGKTG